MVVASALFPLQASADTLVTGRLRDASGHATSGPVQLRAWPLGGKVGQTVSQPVVATTTARPDGSFILAAPVTPQLRAMARRTPQRRIDFVVEGTAGGHTGGYTVSRFLTRNGRLVAPASSRARAATAAASGQGVTVRLRQPVLSSRTTASASSSGCYAPGAGATVLARSTAYVPIGELNNGYRDTRASWSYSRGASTDFDVLFGTPGDYSVGGSYSVENSSTTTLGKTTHSWYSRRMFTLFEFEKTQGGSPCTGKGPIEIRPTRFLGGLAAIKQRGAIKVCVPSNRHRSNLFGGHSFFERSSGEAETWSAGVKVFGTGLSTRTDFSTNVRTRYYFGGPERRRHTICGNDDTPPEAGRIFSGVGGL